MAAITGSSMEVQNASTGQTTVNWTGSTTFDQTVTLTSSGVANGDCVTVTGSSSGGQITARSVSVSPASSSGTCSTGFGGGARAFGGSGRTRPSGSVPRTGGTIPSQFRNGGGGFANGKVVSVSPTSMVIYGTSFSGIPSRSSTSTPPTRAAPANITVTLTSSTTFAEQKPATASNLAVGDCVTATGSSDSTGAVTARSIRITSTGGQTCTTGFAGFGRGGPGAGAAAAASSNA